jgi:hypothetical protein
MTVHNDGTPFERQLDRALARAPLGPPADLADRVLRAAGSDRWPGRARRAVMLIAAALLIVAAGPAFAPVREIASGGARLLAARIDYGAFPYRPFPPPAGATARSNGISVRVVSASDGGGRVRVTLREAGVAADDLTVTYTLTDANGRPLPAVCCGQGESGEFVIDARRPAGSATTGTELTLRITRLEGFDGTWVLRFRGTIS